MWPIKVSNFITIHCVCSYNSLQNRSKAWNPLECRRAGHWRYSPMLWTIRCKWCKIRISRNRIPLFARVCICARCRTMWFVSCAKVKLDCFIICTFIHCLFEVLSQLLMRTRNGLIVLQQLLTTNTGQILILSGRKLFFMCYNMTQLLIDTLHSYLKSPIIFETGIGRYVL